MSFSAILEQLQQDKERSQEAFDRGTRSYASGWPIDGNCARCQAPPKAVAAGYLDFGTETPTTFDPAIIAQAVAAELNLADGMTVEELKILRREFAIRNHPDRLPDDNRDVATLRMQVANLLIDDALRRATGNASAAV
jgi:hypothetical protein